MEWKKLLSKRLLGFTEEISSDGRSQFQKDFDRIVFSSAFRRLQDKTQVFPLPESDYVHTRLTHSLEVSCVGRSLGNAIGEKILERNKKLKDEFTQFHFGEIVASACLGHDIGNPPFGHSGEDAISEYFRNGPGKIYKSRLSKKQWADLTKFEGNAQGFRIITKLQNPTIKGGLRLSCATLAAFTKYPKESLIETSSKAKSHKEKLYKKYGFFQAEKELFNDVAEETGLPKKPGYKNSLFWCRHPLSFLVEAADDICYRIMDLEDGFRLGLLSFNDTEELLMPLKGSVSLNLYNARNENDRIGYLRAKVISKLVNTLSTVFIDEENNIMSGKLDKDLISLLPTAELLEEIKRISAEKIYSIKSVVEREAAGFEVLGGLLDTFINAVNESAEDRISPKNKTIIKLIPKQFLSDDGRPDKDIYTRLLKINDLVSGMTDSYAVSIYRKIKGISLPNR